MTNPEEAKFKFTSKVMEKEDRQFGKILYFPVSYQETNIKLRRHSFKAGDKVEVIVQLKRKEGEAEPQAQTQEAPT